MSMNMDFRGKFLGDANNVSASFSDATLTTLEPTTSAYYVYNLMNMQSHSLEYCGGNSKITVGKPVSSVFLDSVSGDIYWTSQVDPFPAEYCYITRNSIRFTDYIANPVLTGLIKKFEDDSKAGI